MVHVQAWQKVSIENPVSSPDLPRNGELDTDVSDGIGNSAACFRLELAVHPKLAAAMVISYD